jgi:hypothetical protein
LDLDTFCQNTPSPTPAHPIIHFRYCLPTRYNYSEAYVHPSQLNEAPHPTYIFVPPKLDRTPLVRTKTQCASPLGAINTIINSLLSPPHFIYNSNIHLRRRPSWKIWPGPSIPPCW